MGEKPILFSGPMVRAILEGRKTMTRRVVSKHNTFFNGSAWPKGVSADDCNWQSAWVDGGPSPAGNPGPYLHVEWPYGKLCDGGTDERLWARVYPRTQPGDLLWVREDHAIVGTTDPGFVLYRADGYEAECQRHCFDKPYPPESSVKWRPSIHMPRWASRITLRVTGVKVERLQDISDDEAQAEGVESDSDGWRDYIMPCTQVCLSAGESFRTLWTSINGPGSWEANPWVAAYSFERMQ